VSSFDNRFPALAMMGDGTAVRFVTDILKQMPFRGAFGEYH
jgi:hypothetical protein